MAAPVRTLLSNVPRQAPRSLVGGRKPPPGTPNASLAAQLRAAQARATPPSLGGGSTLLPPPESYYNALNTTLAGEATKPASLLGQLKQTAFHLPAGVAGMVKAGVTDIISPFRAGVDLATSGLAQRAPTFSAGVRLRA